MKTTTDRSTIYADAFTYDQIHSGRSVGKDFEFYNRLASNKKNILEIACGTGRITIPMAEAGLKMTGLDVSLEMLAEAKSKAGDNSKIKWIEADCTNFDLKQKFDLIFMTGNSLQHLHLSNQVLAFFSCVNRHLDIGGVFAFDVFLPSLKILSRDSSISFPVLKYKNIEDLEISLNEQNYYNSHTQVNTINWNHLDSSGTILKNDTLEMRQFFPKELDLLVELGGFSIEQKYGNWNLEPDGPDDFKQIMVLKAK